MALLKANFETIVDKLGAIASEIESDFGTADGFASPVDMSDSAEAISVLIAALTTPDVLIDLMKPTEDLASKLLGANASKVFLNQYVHAMAQHIGGFEAYCTAALQIDAQGNAEQVPGELKDAAGELIPAKYVYSAAIDTGEGMGSFDVSGSGAGTFNAGTAVANNRGPCNIEWEIVDGTTGGASIVVTVTALDLDGNEATRTVTIPPTQSVGAKAVFDVGTWIRSISNIAITGGTASDAFRVNGILRRTIAL